VAKIVKAHFTDACPFQCPLEALADLTAIERMPRVRMTEHQIVFGLVGASLEEQFKLAPNPVGHRHGSRGQSRLWRPELATDVRAHDPDLLSRPVNVPPPQPEQLALAQTCHCGSEVQRSVDACEVVLKDCVRGRAIEIDRGCRRAAEPFPDCLPFKAFDVPKRACLRGASERRGCVPADRGRRRTQQCVELDLIEKVDLLVVVLGRRLVDGRRR